MRWEVRASSLHITPYPNVPPLAHRRVGRTRRRGGGGEGRSVGFSAPAHRARVVGEEERRGGEHNEEEEERGRA